MKRVWIKSIVLGIILVSLVFTLSSFSARLIASQASIDYEEIHESILEEINPGYRHDWYEERLKMLFITPDGYENSVKNLSDWKTQKGIPSKIINRTTYMQFSGRDEAERIRNCIKFYYESYGIEWVLLVGDTDLIPTRYIYNPDTRVLREAGSNYYEAAGDDEFKPTDYYYADLTGNWDEDKDGIYGEGLLENSVEEIDWVPEVNVGRFPGNSISEINEMVNKTLYYETAQNPGTWMNSMFLAAAIQDLPDGSDADGEQEVWLANKIIQESVTGNINYTLRAESTEWGTNLSQTTFTNEFNLGQSVVFFAGHGAPTSFNGVGTTIFTSSAANSLENYEMPALVYADACSTNMFDVQPSDNSMGEVMFKNSRGGAIGYIGGMRLSYYYVNDTYSTCSLCELNRGMARLFFQEFFLSGVTQQGKALNEMRTSYMNSVWLQNNPEWGSSYNIHEIEWERKNVLTYTLLGDPEVDIFTKEAKEFDLIQEKFVNEGSSIQVVIKDKDGNHIPDARIALIGEDGAYNTYFADSEGNVTIDFPFGAQDMNYTLTGHNMIPKTGIITLIEDTTEPIITDDHTFSPKDPSVNDKIHFTIPVKDDFGSISCGVVVISEDDFQSYELFELAYNIELEEVNGPIPQLSPGTYSYTLFIYDRAQNFTYITWSEEMVFEIPISITFFFILIANIGLVGFVGYFVIRKYLDTVKGID